MHVGKLLMLSEKDIMEKHVPEHDMQYQTELDVRFTTMKCLCQQGQAKAC